ncbi:hypothetical protein CERSUDRAFT_114267 [Gelatoporia subvermispora B]|uniref:Velvet domain-containing protein n=1 Tax=Ceriporiopsis subvermispora (strain B) TaxID=914234 RepID=M2PMJ1_CERS8|nr:hypothetical protein CERSUDRAFT_114267 [Gelatoporia subvermispora B]
MAAKASRVRASGSSALGAPVTFIAGPFVGRTIRAELVEIQGAELGRKYARKDRRPLDPPPVVQLKLFEVFDESPGNGRGEILPHDEVMGFGFFCFIDLFPLFPNDESAVSTQSSMSQHPQQMQPGPSSVGAVHLPLTAITYDFHTPISTVDGFRAMLDDAMLDDALRHSATLPSRSNSLHLLQASDSTVPCALVPQWQTVAINNGQEAPMPAPTEIVAYHGDTPITATSIATDKLSGTIFRDSTNIGINGKSAIIFVFSDVSVRIEGIFVLRYRVFHVFSQAEGSGPRPVLAECFGEPFKVYSTKDFPGLHASTDLTKNLSIHGIRTNIRARERRRRNATHRARSEARIPSYSSPDACVENYVPPPRGPSKRE